MILLKVMPLIGASIVMIQSAWTAEAKSLQTARNFKEVKVSALSAFAELGAMTPITQM